MNIIKIFIASPGDVLEQCKEAQEVISEESHNHCEKHGFELKPVNWKTDSSPGAGRPHPQGRINPLIDDCDLFVGILWTRFGSSTGVADSGTEEEFNYALEKLANPNAPLCDIKMYFCDFPVPPSKIYIDQFNFDQINKLRVFRERVRSHNILDWTIESREDFKKEFRKHLAAWFHNYISQGGKQRLQPVEHAANKVALTEQHFSAADFRGFNRGF